MVGVIPLFACLVLDSRTLDKLPSFKKRMMWWAWEWTGVSYICLLCHLRASPPSPSRFMRYQKDLSQQVQLGHSHEGGDHGERRRWWMNG